VRPVYGMLLFVLFGLVTAVIIGFRPGLSKPLPEDHEQTGLRDRIVIKFSHVVAENTPKGLTAEHFASLVKQKTNDRVEIQVFPNGMLHSENTEAEALRRGEIQMIAPSFSNMSNIDPAWFVMDLPFAFPDQDAVDEALNGRVGAALFRTVEKQNMHGLAFWSNGFKQMGSNRHPLIEPEDFRNQTFRILPSKVLASQFSALGAATISTPFNEVYRHLQQGIVDGQENTISNIYTKRLYLVQKYMTISNHGYLGYAVIVNKPFWERMHEELRLAVQEAMAETTAWMRQETKAMHEHQLEQIRASGAIEIHELTGEQRRRWEEAMRPVYEQYRSVIGGGLVEEIERLRERRAS